MSDDRSGIFRYVTDVRTRETGGCVERTGVVSDDESRNGGIFYSQSHSTQITSQIIKPLRLAPPLRVRAQPSACSNLLSLSSASHRRLRHR